MSVINRRIGLPTDFTRGSELVFAHGLQLALKTRGSKTELVIRRAPCAVLALPI